MSKRTRNRSWGFPALACVLIIYVASPYYALYSLNKAIQSGDRAALENSVDFPRLRESLKHELSAAVAASADKKEVSDNPFAAGLVMLLAPKIVEAAVDAFVTPAGISQLIQKGKPNIEEVKKEKAEASESPGIQWNKIRYAFFSSPTAFRVETEDALALHFYIRAYPKTPAARKVIQAQAKCSMAS